MTMDYTVELLDADYLVVESWPATSPENVRHLLQKLAASPTLGVVDHDSGEEAKLVPGSLRWRRVDLPAYRLVDADGPFGTVHTLAEVGEFVVNQVKAGCAYAVEVLA